LILYAITINGPALSTDLAQRAITIKLGRPEHSGSWHQKIVKFIADHRKSIIAEILDVLKSEPATQFVIHSRWGEWESAVLSKVPNAQECQDLIRKRQREIDVERSETDDFEFGVARYLRMLEYDPDEDAVFIPTRIIAEWHAKITGDRSSMRSVKQLVIRGHGDGSLKRLAPKDTAKDRGVIWTGEHCDANSQPYIDLEERWRNLKSRYLSGDRPSVTTDLDPTQMEYTF